MANFDYMNFNDGSWDIEFVTHANKFTKEQAIGLCIQENDWRFDPEYCEDKPLRKPTIDDVIMRHVRYYPNAPDYCDWDGDRGVYTYCPTNQRGSFPVWVIEFERLMENAK